MTEYIKDLGYANGWSETPEIVEKCKKLGHKIESEKDLAFNCVNHYWCPICNYRYSIDSSG